MKSLYTWAAGFACGFAVALLLAVSLVQAADLTPPTRVTSYDWRCLDIDGKQVGGAYTRFDTAFVGCWNAPTGLYVESGRYRLNRVASPPPPPPPAPTGSATLTWTPPTANTDGSPIASLTGYTVLYGPSPSTMTQTLQVPGVSTTATVSGLTAGLWYFAVRVTTADGTSAPSNVASKTL